MRVPGVSIFGRQIVFFNFVHFVLGLCEFNGFVGSSVVFITPIAVRSSLNGN